MNFNIFYEFPSEKKHFDREIFDQFGSSEQKSTCELKILSSKFRKLIKVFFFEKWPVDQNDSFENNYVRRWEF